MGFTVNPHSSDEDEWGLEVACAGCENALVLDDWEWPDGAPEADHPDCAVDWTVRIDYKVAASGTARVYGLEYGAINVYGTDADWQDYDVMDTYEFEVEGQDMTDYVEWDEGPAHLCPWCGRDVVEYGYRVRLQGPDGRIWQSNFDEWVLVDSSGVLVHEDREEVRAEAEPDQEQDRLVALFHDLARG